ncbi:MAG: CvpA family protein, partial [Lentisphaerae bacterium]|nr:CvpA family protein [Lentisphaerota bacterium]
MIYGTDCNAVDIAAVFLVLLALLLGWRRGLAGTLWQLLGTLIILLVALRCYRPFGILLTQHTIQLADNPELAGALAFLLISLVLGLGWLVLRALLGVLLTIIFNEKINRGGGAVAGLIQGLALVFLCVYAAGLWPQPAMRQLFVQNSVVGRSIFRLSPRLLVAVESHLPAPAWSLEEPQQP